MSVMEAGLSAQNRAVLRRMKQRDQQGRFSLLGSLPNVMGDYPSDLGNRVLETKGLGPMGPVTSPTIAPPADDQLIPILTTIRDALIRMPSSMALRWRTDFIVQPREAVSFIAPSDQVSVPAGTAVAVCSMTVDQMFTGFLTNVGIYAAAGNLTNITWQVRVNGAIHPKFGTNGSAVFSQSNVSTPLPFALELIQGAQVQLVAINGGTAALDVAGILVGWTEFMSTYKRYGSSPQSGIG